MGMGNRKPTSIYFHPQSAMATICRAKQPAFLPKQPEGVDLLHVAGLVQASDSGFYPPVGFLLNFLLFRVAELSVGVTGRIGLDLRCGSMLLGLFGHGRFHTGAEILDLEDRDGNLAWKWISGYPLSTNEFQLGFYRASPRFPSFPSWGRPHCGARIGSERSGSPPVGSPVPCVAAIHDQFCEVSSQDGVPIYFLLGGWGMVSQPVKG